LRGGIQPLSKAMGHGFLNNLKRLKIEFQYSVEPLPLSAKQHILNAQTSMFADKISGL